MKSKDLVLRHRLKAIVILVTAILEIVWRLIMTFDYSIWNRADGTVWWDVLTIANQVFDYGVPVMCVVGLVLALWAGRTTSSEMQEHPWAHVLKSMNVTNIMEEIVLILQAIWWIVGYFVVKSLYEKAFVNGEIDYSYYHKYTQTNGLFIVIRLLVWLVLIILVSIDLSRCRKIKKNGYGLEQAPQEPVYYQPQQPASPMPAAQDGFCQYCGTPYSAGTTFCKKCGQRIQ